jgi:predicted transcriptional regulator of viral defense system
MRDTVYVMQPPAKSDRVLALARKFPIVRPRDVEDIGVPREYLLRLHRAGQVERVGRGLYRLPNSPVTERHSFALVASRVPQAVICLLSALVFHDIGTQNPFEV